jgi:hypothetical protein
MNPYEGLPGMAVEALIVFVVGSLAVAAFSLIVRFRAATAAEASRQGLGGFVRNLPDGRVEAVFRGPEAEVLSLVAWCRQGPPLGWPLARRFPNPNQPR